VKGSNANNVTIENLCVKYTGAHAISFNKSSNVTIRGCEVGYIGGSLLETNVRYGNGIEFHGETDSMTVENCWIYQCFDAGYTNQGENCYQSNIKIRNNLMEYSPYNIEVWTAQVIGQGGMKDCVIENNILRFAGYGFGFNNRASTAAIGNISFYDYVIPCENVVIKNNVFDCSTRYVISIAYPNDSKGRGPTITGNTWIQKPFKQGNCVACVGQTKFSGAKVYNCGTEAEMKTSVAVFDKSATVILEK
jgi:polygalacturonase